MFQKIGSAIGLILIVVAGGGGYIAVKSHMESEIYRERLHELGADYTRLANEYHEAVRKSAVTELRVQDNELSVLVRTADGVLEEIPTPFDPRRACSKQESLNRHQLDCIADRVGKYDGQGFAVLTVHAS